MVAILKVRRLQDLEDVDPNGLPDGGVPVYNTNVSSFVIGVPASAGAFSMGVTDSGNSLGDTGVTGPRVGLVGSGNITLSQITDVNGGTIVISGAGGGAGGAFSAGISGGNTAGDTGLTGTALALAGGNNITLSGATDGAGGTVTVIGPNTVAQSVQTQSRFNLTLSGNTSGALALVSSGVLTLAGGNRITLSQNGNAVTISGADQSVQPETQTFVGGLAASNTTYTSGTVRITGVGGGVTVSSNTGQRIDISVAAPVAQTGTQFSAGISGGNTSGHSGTVAGRVVLAGGNNITLSGSTNGASETITISAANQTVQTQNMVAVTLDGNTAGALALASSGTVTLAGGNNITLSQNGNAITISGANVGGAQTGISGIVASDTTYSSGTVEFLGSGIVTVGSDNGQVVVIDASQSVQTLGGYALGNTTGQSSSSTLDARSISVRGDGIVSVGYSGGSLRISASQSVQAETQTFVGGIANSQTTYTSGTIGLSELGAVTIRSTTGNQFQISVNSQSVQPETQTFVGGLAASNTTYTSGTISITGVGGGVTVSSNTGQRIDISVAAQSAESQSFGMSNIGNTSGTTGIASGAQVRFLLAGGNNVTLSQSLNGASGTITISAAAQTNQTLGLYALGNTTGQSSSTTRDARSVSVEGAGIISVGYSAGSLRISAIESNQTLGLYAVQNTTGQSSSTTRDARSISVAGDGAVSVGYSAGSLRISAPTQTVQTQNVHNVTLSGNTAGAMAEISSGTLTLAGGNNITLSQNGNAVTISGPNAAGAQTGISGIIASDATYTSGTVEFVGGGIITISSGGGQQVIVSATESNQTLGMYAVGNTTGQSSSTTRDARSVSIDGAGIVSVGYSAGSLRISATTAQSVQSLGMYAVQNTTGQSSSTTMDARTLSIAGDGIVSVGYSAGSLRISASQSVQPETQTFIGGISASDTLYTSGTVRFTGVGGGVTVSSNTGQRVDISVAAQSEQTQSRFNLTISGNTAGAGALVSSGVLTLAGGNNITLSQAGNAITISGGAGGGFSGGVSNVGNTAGDTGITGSRLVLSGGQSITLSQSTNASGGTVMISGASTSQSVQTQGVLSAGVSNVGNTAGNTQVSTGSRLVLAGAGNISLSQATAAGASTISVSGSQSAQTLGMYAVQNTTGQSSSTTMDARTISVAGDGIVSAGYSAGSLRISASQSVQTQGVLSVGVSTGGNTAGNTTVNTGSRVVLVGGGIITASQATAAGASTVTLSASQSVQTQGIVSMGVSTGGNTAGNTTVNTGSRLVFVGTNRISLSQGTAAGASTITISGPDPFVAGASNLGNTAGATGVTGTRLVLVGTNNITLSQTTGAAGATISISGAGGGAGQFSAGVSTGGNTAGATGISGTQMVLVGSGVMSLSQTTGANGNTVSILAPAQSVLSAVAPLSTSTNGSTISFLGPATSSLVGTNGISISTNGSTISVSLVDKTLSYFNPQDAYQQVAGVQGQATLHMQPMQAPNVQFDRAVIPIIVSISNATSVGSHTFSYWQGVYTRNGSTLSLSTSWSTAVAATIGTTNSSLYGSLKLLTIPITHTLTAGQYWVANVYRTSSAGAGNMTFSQVLASQMNSNLSGIFGAANAASVQYTRGLGTFSATTSGVPASIAFSQLTGTGSLVMRQPIFYVVSGTV